MNGGGRSARESRVIVCLVETIEGSAEVHEEKSGEWLMKGCPLAVIALFVSHQLEPNRAIATEKNNLQFTYTRSGSLDKHHVRSAGMAEVTTENKASSSVQCVPALRLLCLVMEVHTSDVITHDTTSQCGWITNTDEN